MTRHTIIFFVINIKLHYMSVLRSQMSWARILVQVMIYRRLVIGRDGHLDQSEAYDISYHPIES